MTKQQALDAIQNCLRVLFYRDARSYNRVSINKCVFMSLLYYFSWQFEIAIVNEQGVEIQKQLASDTNWQVAHYVKYVETY